MYFHSPPSLQRALFVQPTSSPPPLPPNLLRLLQEGYGLQSRGLLEDAAKLYRKVLQQVPDSVDALHLLAMVRGKQLRYEDSIRLYRDALKRRPLDGKLWYNLGLICHAADRPHDAGNAYARAVELGVIGPDLLGLWYTSRRLVCDWSDHAALMAALARGADPAGPPASPFDTLMIDDPHLQLAVARRRFGGARQKPPGIDRTKSASDKIRVGYLSADFREHPTTHLMAALLERHDRSRFEIVAVSIGADDGSPHRQRVIAAVDRFLDCAAGDLDQIASAITEAGIDILVDLMGHTSANKVDLFARRLAPIQVAYLGYPGTTGAPEMDYVIADPAVLPLSQADTFSEAVVHLPETYQPCDPDICVPEAPSRAACGLPDDDIVFCAFNGVQKIDPDTFAIWMDLLRRVPRSVLWLMTDNAHAQANLRRAAQEQGIEADRLVFAPRLDAAAHLARLPLADLFLDTFPYTAHTTANDMLRMGVPVVTRTGATFASRVAGSLVALMGCPELLAQDAQSYAQLALDLAHDRERREALRSHLITARRTSPLFDVERYRAHLEAAYEAMVGRWRAGAPPAAFAVPPVG